MRRTSRRIEFSRLGYHVRLTPVDKGVIAATPVARRILARAVHEACEGAGLLAFGLADNHLHLLLCGERAVVGRAARRLSLMLGWRLSIASGFQQAYIQPIRDGAHLFSTFRYVMRQGERHDLDPAADPWMEATSIPDVLGLRPLGAGVITCVKRALPRARPYDVYEIAGIDRLPKLDGPLADAAEAGCVATALPSLAGKGQQPRCARRAVIELVGDRLRAGDCARLVGIASSTLRRVRSEPYDPDILLALQRVLGFMRERRRAIEAIV